MKPDQAFQNIVAAIELGQAKGAYALSQSVAISQSLEVLAPLAKAEVERQAPVVQPPAQAVAEA